MILVVDNYDSFTYNLVHHLAELGAPARVVRNDALAVADALALRPQAVLLSPGPCAPDAAGITLALLREAPADLPILGVCLGHQAIGQAFGGEVVRAKALMHGKTSPVRHTDAGVFAGLPNPFIAVRYHSLAVRREGLPDALEVTAWTEDGEIMGLAHRTRPVHGVQFHPESHGTPIGHALLANFLRLAGIAPRRPRGLTGGGPPSMAEDLRPILETLAAGRVLDEAQAQAFFTACLRGEATPAQVAAALTALRVRGETVEEIAACARALRACGRPFDPGGEVVDTCGTGGDGRHTLNISTAAAFIAAGGGLRVAKHGNRALSSRSGSSDVLAALGVALEPSPERARRALDEAGVCFLYAPAYNPAMRHVTPVRAELGFRTVFNLLGPLANPARARRQVVGVYDPARVEPLARVLGALGAEHVWVVHGDGLDEITTTGSTIVAAWRAGGLTTFTVTPEAAGLPRTDGAALAGGDPEHNARALLAMLDGERGAYRDIAVLNAAAAFVVADRAATLAEGAALATDSLDGGGARRALDTLKHLTSAA